MLKFIKLIVARAEACIEQRKLLSRFHYCDPYQLYKRICQKQKYITNTLIIDFLKQKHIIASNDDAKVIIKCFNKSDSNIITFQAFYETLFSSEDTIEEKYLIEEADRSSENLLAKYFVSVMAWAKVIQERQQEIEDSYQILNKLFKSHSSICIRRLHRYLNSITQVPKEITLIVFKLIDQKKQQKITKFEFYQRIFQHEKQIEFGKHWKFQSIGCSAEFKSTIHSETDQ